MFAFIEIGGEDVDDDADDDAGEDEEDIEDLLELRETIAPHRYLAPHDISAGGHIVHGGMLSSRRDVEFTERRKVHDETLSAQWARC